nr:glycosyltransferase [uncultured Carboxylicivirga sp.]
MKIVIISPSREVNEAIANHTYLIADALRKESDCEVIIKEIQKNECEGFDCTAISFEHFVSLAHFVNESADVCFLQYDKNAYFGQNARYILTLIDNLKIPIVTFCHTVNNDPDESEKSVLLAISKRSGKLFAKSQLAIDFLEHFYKINPDILVRMEYGIPDLNHIENAVNYNNIAGNDKKILLSTGSLKPDKGYETVINALPGILNHYPDLVYVIHGVTDADEKSRKGDEYKKSLLMLAKSRGLQDKVIFDERALTDYELVEWIRKADLYVVSDINEQCLSNDDLSLAVGAGSVVLSTPTWFAKEILQEDRGQFFSFKSSSELSHLVVNTMRNSSERESYRDLTLLYGSQFTWEKIAQKILTHIESILPKTGNKLLTIKKELHPEVLPDWKPNYLNKLFDGIALFSGSTNDIVDYNKGYSLLDNALAIQVLSLADESDYESETLKRCLSFIQYLQNEDGTWSKGLGFDRIKKEGSCKYAEARTVWALGSLFKQSESLEIKDVAFTLISKLIKQRIEIEDIHSKSAIIIGVSHVLEGGFLDSELIELVRTYANFILKRIPEDGNAKWQWYEDELTGKYGLVPLALLYAHTITGEKQYLSAARRTCRFIEKLLFTDDIFNPAIQGYSKNQDKIIRGNNEQLSSEAFLMVACYSKLYQVTKEKIYLTHLSKAHLWYLGNNNLQKSVYDQMSGGCYQALGMRGVNPLKGTDSTCAFWLSHFMYLDTYFKELEE